jgi:anti-sigma factor RsiW
MMCNESQQLIDPYLDNELDLRSALEVEEHFSRCAACAAEERSSRELQESARALLTRYPMRPEFKARLLSSLNAKETEAPVPPAILARPRARRFTRWAAAALPAAAAVALIVVAAPRIWSRQSESSLEDAVIVAHVRSLLANHLTDVASSDQHTVKPWFQGKLDYSVSVTDWAGEGFPLVGGRLDYVENTSVAALVYKRGQHVINLFVWPNKGGKDEPVQRFARRGYCAYRWSTEGMNYWAVSDVNDTELKTFVELARQKP